MKKGILKKIVTFIVLTVTVFAVTVPTFAATKWPYNDVGPASGAYSFKAIKYLKAHKAFKGIVKGKNYKPDKFTNRHEFLKALVNLYGKKNVPISATDKKKFKKKITPNWVFKKLNQVAKKLGGPTRQVGDLMVIPVTREWMAVYIYDFCRLDKKFRPKK